MVCWSLNIGQSEGKCALRFKGKEMHPMEVSSSQRGGTAQQPPVSPLCMKLQSLICLSSFYLFTKPAVRQCLPCLTQHECTCVWSSSVCCEFSHAHPEALQDSSQRSGREGCSSLTPADLLQNFWVCGRLQQEEDVKKHRVYNLPKRVGQETC